MDHKHIQSTEDISLKDLQRHLDVIHFMLDMLKKLKVDYGLRSV